MGLRLVLLCLFRVAFLLKAHKVYALLGDCNASGIVSTLLISRQPSFFSFFAEVVAATVYWAGLDSLESAFPAMVAVLPWLSAVMSAVFASQVRH